LSELKPDLYDLLLIDTNVAKMISSEFINQEALREQYLSLSIGCFIRKPVTIDNLVKRVKAELD
jgi:hypothetical protein